MGGAATKAAVKEMKQLHDRVCMTPIHKKDLTSKELKEAMGLLLFLMEKETKQVMKSRHVADRSALRPFADKNDAAGLTVSNDGSLFMMVAADTQE